MATTQVEKKTEYGFGTAGHGDLSHEFATTMAEYTPDVARAILQAVQDELNLSNIDVPAFDPNYTGAPKIEKFYPDRGWPAGGTTNPTEITPGPVAKASGAGSQDQPADSAASVSKQKIGQLIFGTSKPG